MKAHFEAKNKMAKAAACAQASNSSGITLFSDGSIALRADSPDFANVYLKKAIVIEELIHNAQAAGGRHAVLVGEIRKDPDINLFVRCLLGDGISAYNEVQAKVWVYRSIKSLSPNVAGAAYQAFVKKYKKSFQLEQKRLCNTIQDLANQGVIPGNTLQGKWRKRFDECKQVGAQVLEQMCGDVQ